MKSLVSLFFVLAAGFLNAQEPTAISGGKLLELCSAPDATITSSTPADTPLKGAMCYGFLIGADQAIAMYGHGAYCLEPGVDFKEIRLVVIKFLNSHPELLHKPAAESFSKALGEAFPCQVR